MKPVYLLIKKLYNKTDNRLCDSQIIAAFESFEHATNWRIFYETYPQHYPEPYEEKIAIKTELVL